MNEIILRIENLRKEYGEVIPLKNINLEVRRGEIISIIGGSGTGKTNFIQKRRENPRLFRRRDESPLDFVNLKRYIFKCGGLPRNQLGVRS